MSASFNSLNTNMPSRFLQNLETPGLFRRAFPEFGEIFRRNLARLDVLAFLPTDLRFADDFGQRAFHAQLDGTTIVLAHPAGEFENLVAEQRFLADDLRDLFQMRIRASCPPARPRSLAPFVLPNGTATRDPICTAPANGDGMR